MDTVMIFMKDIAIVAKNGKFGAIDLSGKEIIPFKYQSIGEFSDGIASFSLEDKFGFVNKNGKEIVSAKYDDVQRFEDGFAKVSLAGKWGTIDKTGKEIIAVKYDDIHDFSGGLACVGIGDNWGYVDTTGKEIIPLKFENTYWEDDNTIHARKPDGTIVNLTKKRKRVKMIKKLNNSISSITFNLHFFLRTKNKLFAYNRIIRLLSKRAKFQNNSP
ncbi:MAG: WG repeat-containing protein [Flavobacterium sp.]|nr:WG repeat-containing protein [Flavobacterium sp.]